MRKIESEVNLDNGSSEAKVSSPPEEMGSNH